MALTQQTGDVQWTVVIPVKPSSSAKSRLGLGPELARAIALDTVAAVVACSAVDRVLVVTADETFRPAGAEIVRERSAAGIDSAVRLGAELAAGRPRAAILGDLPSLRPEDLAAALELAAQHPRGFVADRETTGTTMVTAAQGLPLLTAFGPGSAHAHRALGLIRLDLSADSTVTADVDTVEQLRLARELGLGPASRAVLAEEGREVMSHVPLGGGVLLRPLAIDDVAALTKAYLDNSEHLAQWDPERAPTFFTEPGQESDLQAMIAQRAAGTALPLVLSDGARIVGRVTLSRIFHGPLQSAALGYWIDSRYAGRGLMTAAVGAVVDIARDQLGLHRLEAGTLLHNVASQAVLTRCGFVEYGMAPQFLRIAGKWQDHRLFQRILT